MNYEITKFKLKKGNAEIHYRQELGEIIKEHVTTIFCAPHPDLVKAMDKLKVHLVFITEMVETHNLPYLQDKGLFQAFSEDDFYDELCFLKFTCTGIALSSGGVVLIGQKALGTKKVLNITSPFTMLDEDSDYTYCSQLYRHLDDVIHEVNLLLNGKVGFEQLELFTQEEAA